MFPVLGSGKTLHSGLASNLNCSQFTFLKFYLKIGAVGVPLIMVG